MKLTIDNLNGNGTIDYSGSLLNKPPVSITRKLNVPSICSFALALNAPGPETPLRNGRVIVTDDNGVVLFTGYVVTEPARELAGAGTTGAICQLTLTAESDEVLLDRQSVPQTRATAGQTAGRLLSALTSRVDPTLLTLNIAATPVSVGHFMPDPGQCWSQNAGSIAAMARSAYSAISGTLSLAPIGTVTHVLSESAGTLQVKSLNASRVKTLANDITVCGTEEGAAYVTEIFSGDGSTVVFDLTLLPYFPTASHSKALVDLFQGAVINPVLWQIEDGGGHISLTAAGLTLSGGNGIDGQTAVVAIDQLEVGGALVIEAGGVQFGALSAGIVCGLYTGSVSAAGCFAGFLVEQVAGATVVSPLIEGVAAGATFTPTAGHSYTLRIRTYCVEIQRILAAYYAVGSNGEVSYGGNAIPAGAKLVIEVQDTTSGATDISTVLYDGWVVSSPALVTFAPVNSTNLIGSIASIHVTEAGAVWVMSQDPGGSAFTRKLGLATQGADARIERNGRLRFYTSAIPAANETITVTYRTAHRSVARLANSASVGAEGNGTIPGTARWIGSVTSPVTRSSADCENAAFTLLAQTTSRDAAWSGSYTGFNLQAPQDFWPGDLLAVNSISLGINVSLVVRAVSIEASTSSPDLPRYTIEFANDWAEALSMKVSISVPKDAWLPQQAQTAVTVLASLTLLAVSSVTGTVIQIAAGVSPPAGGGFEVRRRDWYFGPSNDADLVLRSPVSNFAIPREAAIEQYFIRQYDASSPANYSRFSSAVFINVPL
ncbi:hypothetical protein ACPOL_4306 [Acidisarcina polymorpha]|uniref:Uncharacterized protein n=1 Tax=Acidisarcina polymorpha TaxID=2211140 RepID=A0A2Z5G379_9BACT|nr:hypothetical protein [Acidisarcina polymorpha]AXC13581.1 hypothetical protein ACPOL_4306 [Acidisarcina polymorpha]